jgi:nitric oxide reductase subunit B
MGFAALLFLAQHRGGGIEHYGADPASFYGFDVAALLPSNLLRTWHLQLAILWIATVYVGGALFVASRLAGKDLPGLRAAFAAMVLVIVGSLLGEWAGLLHWLPRLWFWLGNQGWEYPQIGGFWQYLLALGLVFWLSLLMAHPGAGAPRSSTPRTRQFLPYRDCGDPDLLFARPLFRQHHKLQRGRCVAFLIIHLWVGARRSQTAKPRQRLEFVRSWSVDVPRW